MWKKVLGTVGIRYFVAILNLALIFINARMLGVQGIGLVGIIVASVNIAVVLNSILCGNTIVYFMNKYSMKVVFSSAYLWIPAGSTLACGVMYCLGLLPNGYVRDIFLLSLLSSFVAANTRLLLGKDKVKAFNLTFFLQSGLLFFILLYIYYVMESRSIGAYLGGMYIANGIALVVSGLLLIPLFRKEESRSNGLSFFAIFKEMFSYGLWSCADNLAETYTTRLNYFLLHNLSGLGSVGLLDAGTKISEGVWNISKSVSFIEYSEVAKESDKEKQKNITLRLFKFTVFATTSIMAMIILVPEWIYTDYLFTSEFKGINHVIIALAPGIVALGSHSILSHYFIASGKVRISAYSSFIGLTVLLIVGYILIPAYGVIGSAISSSIAFSSMLTFSIIVFSTKTNTTPKEYLPTKEDIRTLLRLRKGK
jgi:Membrane protein involved in the export of O-antigen and teichoic acid